MSYFSAAHRSLAGLGLVVWVCLVAGPLVYLYGSLVTRWPPPDQLWSAGAFMGLLGRSVAVSALVAAVAVMVGLAPARLFAASRRHSLLVFALMLAPLMIPGYVLYYIWSLLLSPTTAIGRFLGSYGSVELARWIAGGTASMAQVMWYWPLAALVIGQGWRTIDADLLDASRLDAGRWQRLTRVTLPLLGRPILLAFALCFVLVMGEYGVFHLAGVTTLGTELGVVYEATGSATAVARAALPLLPLAAIVVFLLSRDLPSYAAASATVEQFQSPRWGHWVVFGLLVVVTLGAPVAILVHNLDSLTPLREFLPLQWDGLRASLATAALAALLAIALAVGPLALAPFGSVYRRLATVMQVTTIFAVFMPGSLIGVAMLKLYASHGLVAWAGQGESLVAAGQAVRYAGLALLLIILGRESRAAHYREMAAVDGASSWQAWRYVHLPLVWPAMVAAGLVVAMLSLTELGATLVLLPPGVPNFTQRLLNQMHYARDQQVIVSLLLLVGVYLALVGAVAVLARVAGVGRRRATVALLIAAAAVSLPLAGCDSGPPANEDADVVAVIGSTGPGPGEFLYPRALDLDPGGDLYVADKTGRIQHLGSDGSVLSVIVLPAFDAGKPTGISVAPDGRLFVADTHYHRVLIYDSDGTLADQFGEFGTGPGQFIYPTDVAFAPDGRMFVSEYGGNDRVSIYSADGKFLSTFGSLGEGVGQFSRPAALCVDARRGCLYVADACNHRIVRYSLDGQLLGSFGEVGQRPGQLRYPYGLALLPGGDLLVTEYGNNRLQILTADGRSRRLIGHAGRRTGELAMPWGIAVDSRGRAFIVDAGNNRVQVWQL